jgi:hypothetical protein
MNNLYPVQKWSGDLNVSESIYLAAYEVYSHVYGPQTAMIDIAKGCRGGFTLHELVVFLYARSFPKNEWRTRIFEAFNP